MDDDKVFDEIRRNMAIISAVDTILTARTQQEHIREKLAMIGETLRIAQENVQAKQEVIMLQQLFQSQQTQWPEVMTFETAGRYTDRGTEGIRHLIRKKIIPKVLMDAKPQVRRKDIDAAAERSRF